MRTVEQRLFTKLVFDNNCLAWTGSGVNGYGRIGINGKHKLVHRVMWEMFIGEIPKGLILDHLCRNRKCVSLNHLEIVSQRKNILRGVGISAKNAKKTHCKRGHPFNKSNTYIRNTPWGYGRVCRVCLNKIWRKGKKSYSHG